MIWNPLFLRPQPLASLSQLKFVHRKRHKMRPELKDSEHVRTSLPDKGVRHTSGAELCSEQNGGKPVGHLFVTQTGLKQVFKFAERLILHKLGNEKLASISPVAADLPAAPSTLPRCFIAAEILGQTWPFTQCDHPTLETLMLSTQKIWKILATYYGQGIWGRLLPKTTCRASDRTRVWAYTASSCIFSPPP